MRYDQRYYYFYDCTGSLAILDADRWSVVQLPVNVPALDPAWSLCGDCIDADGMNLHRLTRGPHSSPAWRP
jgi:hypothetical protein